MALPLVKSAFTMVLYIGFRWGLLQMIKKDTRYLDTELPKILNFFTDRVEPPLKY